MLDPELLHAWNIELSHERPDISIAGSPERTDFRVVIEDTHSRLFIVEAIQLQQIPAKIRISNILDQLTSQGITHVRAYCKNINGGSIFVHKGRAWQVVPYVKGVDLCRPEYVLDHWRGEAAAHFLLALRKISPTDMNSSFSLPDYIRKLGVVIRQYRPDVFSKVQEMELYIKANLFPVYDQMPCCFSHGDYHALNIIWERRNIASVIDWEFCGLKPELYDAANMVSCLGIEDPESLWSGAVIPFLKRLKYSGEYSDLSIKYFLPLVIALRFAWLSEWLRKNDNEMIHMEFDYFDILSAQADNLSSIWWK